MLRKNVSFINCSFTRILLTITICIFGSWFIKTFIIPERFFAAPVSLGSAPNRALKWDKHPHAPEGALENAPYFEVQRNSPKISFSTKQTLEKLLEKERKERNKSPGFPIKLSQDAGFLGGGSMGFRGNAGLSKLKDNLKDPSFVGKIEDLESKRQGLYVNILRKRGQIVRTEQGDTIVSYPQAPVMFPNNLKKPLKDWSKNEKLWLNITHFPWPEDTACQKYSVTFGSNIPIVGLASYPSSGNTWIRYLVECASGIFSGSMYNDVMLRKKGFYGEGVAWEDRKTLTIKTHGHTTGDGALVNRSQQHNFNHMDEVNRTAILLIRNPFEAIIGHRNLDQGGHTGLAKPEEFQGKGWNEFVRIKAEAWLNFYKDWLEGTSRNKILVIHYEHLKMNLRHTIRRILDFLNLEEDEGRLGCIDLYPKGHFKREKKQTIKDPFTDDQKEMVKESILLLDQYLSHYGKETLPTKLYKYYN